jgi:hypothetical protein
MQSDRRYDMPNGTHCGTPSDKRYDKHHDKLEYLVKHQQGLVP